MTKDKDSDDPKDNVLTFPSKPKKSDNDTHYEITISDFSPQELHERMIALDQSYEACFHFTKALEYSMHTLHGSLELEKLSALELKLKQLFESFSGNNDKKG